MKRPKSANAETRRGEHHVAMCNHIHRELLLPYALTGTSPSDGIDFEAHLLGCDACFADLKILDRAAAVIGDPDVARLTLADLFYNVPQSSGPNDRLRAILDSIPPSDRRSQAGSA